MKRKNITLINREKGAGSRVLLDEHLRLLNIYGSSIKGYDKETESHLTIASTVSRGMADVGVGIEKIASQVEGVDFIPLQNGMELRKNQNLSDLKTLSHFFRETKPLCNHSFLLGNIHCCLWCLQIFLR